MKSAIVLSFLSAFALTGCASTGAYTRTGGGWIGSFKEGLTATTAKSIKRGQACSQNILGIVTGDSSIETAKLNGGIHTVSTVDSEITNILFLYGRNCTLVSGE